MPRDDRRGSGRAAAKKQRERQALLAAQQLDRLFPRESFRNGKEGMEPDFVFDLQTGVIGVEIVEYFRPDLHRKLSMSAQERFTKEVVDEVRAECGRSGVTHVSAFLTFDYSVRLRKSDVAPLARQIVELIKPSAEPNKPRLRITRPSQLPAGIMEIAANHLPTETAYVILDWSARPVPPIDETRFMQLLDAKHNKLEKIYRHTCAEVWLLFIVDQYKVASMAYVPPTFRLSASRFDRVVVVQGWSDTIEVWNANAQFYEPNDEIVQD